MKIISGIAVVFLATIVVYACGDLDEIDDDELREFVQRARRVARQELAKDVSPARIDALEQTIIDVLQGDDGTSALSRGTCWEDGLRTTFLATQADEVRRAGIAHAPHDGLRCTDHYLDAQPNHDGVTCVSANCSCYADGVLQGHGNYATACVVSSTNTSETNLYSTAQASVYEPSLVPDGIMSDYAIMPTVLGTKHPGYMFDVTVLAGNTPLPQRATASLTAYDLYGKEATAALAQWKNNLHDNIYAVDQFTGANFNEVFFMQASLAKGIQMLGGVVDGKGFRRAYVIVEGLAFAATQVLLAHQYDNDLVIVLGGPAQDAFRNAGRALSYLAVNAAGEVVSRQLRKTFSHVLEVDGSYLIRITGGTCVIGNPVLIRMGGMVHETTCH